MPLQRKQQQSPWWFGAAWQIFRSCMSIGRVAAMAMVVALASPAAYAQTELPDPGVLKDQAITTPGGSVRPPSGAVNVPGGSVRRAGEVGKPVGPIPPPGHAIGDQSITEDLWSRIRHGQRGEVANPYGESGILIQSQGTDWMAAHNDQVVPYGGWLLLGTLAAIAVFFLVRGRIRIEGGAQGW